MKACSVLVIVVLLCGCASKDMRPQLEQGMGGIPSAQYSDARTVEEIRALKPQAKFPLKIAVMPSGSWEDLSQEERAIIESWEEQLKEIGFVKTLSIIPKSLIPSCGYKSDNNCFLQGSRVAGARVGADAILFLSSSTATDSYVNPLSILNLTIVGMWVVPAHHRDSYSIYEAALFDIDNGYLYAVAEGSGEHKLLRPYMYIEYRTGQKEARIKALNEVGKKLYGMAKEQIAKFTAPNNGR
jgi:rhombotail lipoprotein